MGKKNDRYNCNKYIELLEEGYNTQDALRWLGIGRITLQRSFTSLKRDMKQETERARAKQRHPRVSISKKTEGERIDIHEERCKVYLNLIQAGYNTQKVLEKMKLSDGAIRSSFTSLERDIIKETLEAKLIYLEILYPIGAQKNSLTVIDKPFVSNRRSIRIKTRCRCGVEKNVSEKDFNEKVVCAQCNRNKKKEDLCNSFLELVSNGENPSDIAQILGVSSRSINKAFRDLNRNKKKEILAAKEWKPQSKGGKTESLSHQKTELYGVCKTPSKGKKEKGSIHEKLVNSFLELISNGADLSTAVDLLGVNSEIISHSFKVLGRDRKQENLAARLRWSAKLHPIGSLVKNRKIISEPFQEASTIKREAMCVKCGKIENLSHTMLERPKSCGDCTSLKRQESPHIGKQYGWWEILSRIEGNWFSVKCNGCNRTFRRQLAPIISHKSRSCVHCSKKYKALKESLPTFGAVLNYNVMELKEFAKSLEVQKTYKMNKIELLKELTKLPAYNEFADHWQDLV